jgi:hypothetical protein
VIPTGWQPVHRPPDGEHVGYLAPDGSPERVVPLTLVGSALGPAQDRTTAVALLTRRGLAALDRRWWCRLPVPLVDGTDAATPEDDWAWSAVVLVEASPDGCRVRLEYAEPAEMRAPAALPVPVGDLLLEHPPEE